MFVEPSKAVIMQSFTVSVCGQIHWQQVKEPVGHRDQPVLVVCQAARRAGLPRLCLQDIHMPLG